MVELSKIAVVPEAGRHESLKQAVRAADGVVAAPGEASAIVWADPAHPEDLGPVVELATEARWIALPFAGVEPYVPLIRQFPDRLWTCARDVYSRPVAEHAIALATSGLRHVVGYARQSRWTEPHGHMLVDGRLTIFGGGGIAAEIIRLLHGWNCEITVVRRNPQPMDGVARVLGSADAIEAVRGADAVILAVPLTAETAGLIGGTVLAAMEPHAWLVNVARGGVVDTDALVEALVEGSIGGAALDVTDPEPLPEGHRLWSLPNVVITPHIANTPEMGIPLLAEHIRQSVATWLRGNEPPGRVDPAAGY